jgi:hypothetical protein
LADHHWYIQAKRTKPVARRKAIADMVAEQQLQGRPARCVDLFGLALDDHAGFDLCAARRHELPVDFNNTDQARVKRATLFQIAEGRNIDAQRPGRREYRLTRGNFQASAVNRNRHSGRSGVRHFRRLRVFVHFTSMALCGQACRQVSHRVHNSRLIECFT